MYTTPHMASAAPDAAALAKLANTYAAPALAAITGQVAAELVIERLRDGTAQPAELAELLAELHGHELAGACGAIAKALVAGRGS